MDPDAAICSRGSMSVRFDRFAYVFLVWVVGINLAGLAACRSSTKPSPDAADVCSACGAGTICVQSFDGTCHSSGPSCVPTTESCPVNTCSAACQQALCPSPYQCQNRPPCGTEVPGAFLCYGP